MKIFRSSGDDRVERVLRWALGIALMAAVGWAWAQGAAKPTGDGRSGETLSQRSR